MSPFSFTLYPLPIRTPRGMFLYDPGSNHIFETDATLFGLAMQAIESDDPATEWASINTRNPAGDEIARVREQGYLCAHRVQVEVGPSLRTGIGHPKNSYIAPTLVVEVTEDCNLRCSYCTYNGDHNYRRVRSSKRTSFSLIRRAIDLVAFGSDPSEPLTVSFYGGEPLLEADTLLRSIDYTKTKYGAHRRLQFGITTNGMLLDLPLAHEFITRKVSINVSLDGARDVHDRARVDTYGGGSYERILDNLRAVSECWGDRIIHYFGLQATLDPETWTNDLLTWFRLEEEEPFVRGLRKQFNFVSNRSSAFVSGEPRDEEGRLDEGMVRLLAIFIRQALRTHGLHQGITGWLWDPDLSIIHKRPRFPLLVDHRVVIGGACVPGGQRLFVSVDGRLFPCERVDDRFQIGTVDGGVDNAEVTRVLESWRSHVSRICQGCWAVRFCQLCLADISGSTDPENALSTACQSMRERWAFALWLYCRVREIEDSALDYLHSVMVN